MESAPIMEARDAIMIGEILQFSDLQELCMPGKRPRRSTVEAWAKSQGIAYRYDGRGGIWTTPQALNTALGVAHTLDHENTEDLL